MDTTKSNSYLVPVLVGILLIAAFGLGFLWNKVQQYEQGGYKQANNGALPSAPEAPAGELAPVTEDDWMRGNKDAKIALVEYSDLECPFCKQFHPTAQQLVDEYQDQVVWVFRHFPLESIHPKARPFAIAAECAGQLGGEEKFWEMADAIYEQSPALLVSGLTGIATNLGLSGSAFDECIASDDADSAVQEDINTGATAGVRGTPANFIVNLETGEFQALNGAVPYAQLKAALESMLK